MGTQAHSCEAHFKNFEWPTRKTVVFFLKEKLSTQIRLSTKYTVYRNKKYIYMDSLYFIISTKEKCILMNPRHRALLYISDCKDEIILFKISIGFSLCVFLFPLIL